MPQNDEAMDEITARTDSRGMAEAGLSTRLMARMVAPTPTAPIRYQSLGERVVSARGAHSTFQVCGRVLKATRAPMAATDRPLAART